MAKVNFDGKDVTPDAVFKALPIEVQQKILTAGSKRGSLNILVIGQMGAGKSRLVNLLLGSVVAQEGRGALSVTTELEVHEGEFMGVSIRIYDTVGFDDTEGRSDTMRELARHNKFALILMCVRMDSRLNSSTREMLATLSDNMHPDAWKRVVVVLTFADVFIEQDHIRPDEKEIAMTKGIEEYKKAISRAVNNPAFNDVPFCVVGKLKERGLPATNNDWLANLWSKCLNCFDDIARPIFEAFTIFLATKGCLDDFIKNKDAIAVAGGAVGGVVGAVIGAMAGAFFGSCILPGLGTAQGAYRGMAMGAILGTKGTYEVILHAAKVMASDDFKAIRCPEDKCKEL